MLTSADLAAARSALLFTRRALSARNEPTAAFDHAIAALDEATADYGSRAEVPCHTEYVDTAEAAIRLGTSERWVRDLAPRIGGRKVGGRWIIPTDSLPEPEEP